MRKQVQDAQRAQKDLQARVLTLEQENSELRDAGVKGRRSASSLVTRLRTQLKGALRRVQYQVQQREALERELLKRQAYITRLEREVLRRADDVAGPTLASLRGSQDGSLMTASGGNNSDARPPKPPVAAPATASAAAASGSGTARSSGTASTAAPSRAPRLAGGLLQDWRRAPMGRPTHRLPESPQRLVVPAVPFSRRSDTGRSESASLPLGSHFRASPPLAFSVPTTSQPSFIADLEAEVHKLDEELRRRAQRRLQHQQQQQELLLQRRQARHDRAQRHRQAQSSNGGPAAAAAAAAAAADDDDDDGGGGGGGSASAPAGGLSDSDVERLLHESVASDATDGGNGGGAPKPRRRGGDDGQSSTDGIPFSLYAAEFDDGHNDWAGSDATGPANDDGLSFALEESFASGGDVPGDRLAARLQLEWYVSFPGWCRGVPLL